MKNKFIDKFGYLPEPVEIVFSIGKITPLPELPEIYKNVSEHSYKNSYLFPPQIITKIPKKKDIENNIIENFEWVDEPGSQRPAPMMYLPPTHSIEIQGPYCSSGRMGIGTFLINLAAFLYGTRAQFYDWKVDGRAIIKRRNCFIASKKPRELFFEAALDIWKNKPDEYRIRIANILFLYLRALSEEYDWLEFTLLYMVFDSCYWLANKYYGVTAKTHKERFNKVSNCFNIYKSNINFNKWSKDRNNLFHEALWHGNTPGSSTISKNYVHLLYFQSFLCRVISALLGYDNSFISSKWDSVGYVSF
jgi:hypothetical protein